jgi:hypothetical protein
MCIVFIFKDNEEKKLVDFLWVGIKNEELEVQVHLKDPDPVIKFLCLVICQAIFFVAENFFLDPTIFGHSETITKNSWTFLISFSFNLILIKLYNIETDNNF